MLKFQEQALREELGQLPAKLRVAFAVGCAQRLVSVYRVFAAKTEQPDGAKLESALEYVWTHLLLCQNKETTERVLAEVMALIPNEDAPGWTPLTAYAEDAVSAVAYSLRCLLSSDPQDAAWAARRVYEALDQFVISRDDITLGDPGAEDHIVGDPIVQAELERQRRDISDLMSTGEPLPPELLESFRVRSSAEQAIVLPS